ncbi:saccharopine dehydrogenase family protein [Flavobacterium cerinum]|uniref:Saccharopine dehydrogenase NADP-binding domain-containing protein n=1 Tax=Flavobacterium cerinum TaxID=2502784 RepID=A0ABY5IWS6_9FLAO|nr:saccharopine dehydrogenase NADP-binding domain-containing protein [Flavobacterium cerinum]UUC47278.1 saccharopine dehydrogenase NADP-binding domain-containing protein [Flavobacterium cerinum]
MKDNIVVIGGYGAVGGVISRNLAHYFPGKVIVAGRSWDKAEQLAKKLEHKVLPYQLDISDPENIVLPANTSLVIMCIDQDNARFVAQCIERGIHYIDITANQKLITEIELLDDKAKKNEVSVILSVGLAPGITNLLVQQGINQLPESISASISMVLGLGEKHGDAAYRWTFDNIHSSYILMQNDKPVTVKSFSIPEKTTLLGNRRFYSFNFSDQHTLSKTTQLKQVVTRMAFDSEWITRGMAILRKTGLTRLFRFKMIQNSLIPIFKKLGIGSDVFGVKAEVVNSKGMRYSCSLTGYGEGKVTAYCAIETALYLNDNPALFGVKHSHQIIKNIPDFLQRLKKYDETLQISID